jgi:hypothetical protein
MCWSRYHARDAIDTLHREAYAFSGLRLFYPISSMLGFVHQSVLSHIASAGIAGRVAVRIIIGETRP